MEGRKILIVTNRVPYPLKDGGNIAMNAMIEGYHRAGWQVYLLSMNTSRHFIKHEQLEELFRQLYKFEWVDVDNRLRWTDVAKNFFFSREPEHAVRFNKAHFRHRLLEIISSFRPDVVQMESVYLATYVDDIKAHSHALTVLRLHNVEYQIWQGLSRRIKNPVKRVYLSSLAQRVRDFERSAWKQYDLLLPITEKDAHLVNRLEAVEHVVVIPFSISTERISPGTAEERWVGYHIGAMDWIANREGIQWFLDKAWPGIHRAVPKFEFYFAGRNMPGEFKKLGLTGVHCLDEVPDAEAFIADKKILIVPLRSGGGIRVKILEAMAAGKIVITTPVGIKGIEAKPGVHYLLARKPEDFVRAVKWCLANKADAIAMAKKAQELMRDEYDDAKVMGKVTQMVNGLLDARE